MIVAICFVAALYVGWLLLSRFKSNDGKTNAQVKRKRPHVNGNNPSLQCLQPCSLGCGLWCFMRRKHGGEHRCHLCGAPEPFPPAGKGESEVPCNDDTKVQHPDADSHSAEKKPTLNGPPGQFCRGCSQVIYVDADLFQCCTNDASQKSRVRKGSLRHNMILNGREFWMHVKVPKNDTTVFSFTTRVSSGEFPSPFVQPDLPPPSEVLSVLYHAHPVAEVARSGTKAFCEISSPGRDHTCGQSFNSSTHFAQPDTGCSTCVYLASQLKECKDFFSGRTTTPRVTVVAYTPHFCNKSLRFKSGWTNKFLPDASILHSIGRVGHGSAVALYGPILGGRKPFRIHPSFGKGRRYLRAPPTTTEEAATFAEGKQVKSNRNTYATSVALLVLLGFVRIAYASAAFHDELLSWPSLLCYPKVTVHPGSDVKASFEEPSVGRDALSAISKGPTQGYYTERFQPSLTNIPSEAPGTVRIQQILSAVIPKVNQV